MIALEPILDLDNLPSHIISPKLAAKGLTFTVNANRCSNPEMYQDYLMFEAYDAYKSGYAVTHLYVMPNYQQILGYVALRSSSLISELSPIIGEAALEIYMLAVDSRYENLGVGSALMDLVLDVAYTLREESIGIQYVVVSADPAAVGFYQKFGFAISNETLQFVPHSNNNLQCVPMHMKLSNIVEPLILSDEDDDTEEWPWPFD